MHHGRVSIRVRFQYSSKKCIFSPLVLNILLILNVANGAEVAAEATDFFDSMEQSAASLEFSLLNISDESTNFESLSRSTSLNSQQGAAADQSWEIQSMGSLRSMLESKDTPLDLRIVPKMSQRHFIALWKTLYDMFPAQPEDQEVYHSIATIGKS